MPQVDITIGGRAFEVACQDGEEPYLTAAARLLDMEAAALSDQVGRMPESRMLLMAGLMLADKASGLEERLRSAERLAAELKAQVTRLEGLDPPEAERVEVPVVPQEVTETLAELAARAEAMAEEVERRADAAGSV